MVPASTPEEELGPGSDFRGIPRGPRDFTWNLDLLKAPLSGDPEVSIVTRGPIQLEKTREILHSTRAVALFLCGF